MPALEDEDGLPVCEEDLVPCQAEECWVEGWTLCDELLRPRKPTLRQGQYDGNLLMYVGVLVCERHEQLREFIEKADAQGYDANELSIAL